MIYCISSGSLKMSHFPFTVQPGIKTGKHGCGVHDNVWQ